VKTKEGMMGTCMRGKIDNKERERTQTTQTQHH